MDIKEDSKIPLMNGRIVMKATRVSWESNQSFSIIELILLEGADNKSRSTSEAGREARTNSNASYGASYAEVPTKPQQNAQNGNFGMEVKINSL